MNDGVVYVVDDDRPVRDSLRMLIASAKLKVECFASGEEFLAGLDAQKNACAVLDIRMPDMSGLDLQEELNRRGIEMPIIFLTGHGDIQMAVTALKEGAHDFFEKPFRDQALLDSVRAALKDNLIRRSEHARTDDIRDRLKTLTPRENEVMRRIVDGQANKVIAAELELSERTVEIHRAKVMHKMGSGSLAQLVRDVMSAD